MLPIPIYKDKKITTSADGSTMFYSLEYNEAYRAKSIGAFTESRHKFVNASGILEKAARKDVRILDLCFGLGYNCAVTFYYAKQQHSNRIHIVSVERDPHLLEIVNNLRILWPSEGYSVVRQCLSNGSCGKFSMEIHLWEALESIYRIGGKFDAIYFDPFSIAKNPEMWTVDVFRRMYYLLEDDGALVTYACGKQARSNMEAAGLIVEEMAATAGAFHPGTRAFRHCEERSDAVVDAHRMCVKE